MARTTCIACGGFLSDRAWPAGRRGSWCPRCRGWWPDDDDHPDDRPPRWRLVDGTAEGLVALDANVERITALREAFMTTMADAATTLSVTLDANRVRVAFGDGTHGEFSSTWLLDNRPGNRDAHSGQRLIDVADLPLAASAWVRETCARLTRGFALFIDYGHLAPRLFGPAHPHGTLTAYRRHTQPSDDDGWLDAPGEQDLTAHVDFSGVQAAARAAGCEVLGLMDQTYFLMALATPLLDSLSSEIGRAHV